MDLGLIAQGLGTLAAGIIITIYCRLRWGSSEWLAKETDSLMRGHNRPQSQWDRATWWLRFTLAFGMIFGGLIVVIGIVSVIAGFRQ